MAEAMLIGAGVGAGTSILTGQDPIKGAALGGAMGGATAGFGGAGVASGAGAGAGAGSTSMMQTLATPAMTSGATAVAGGASNSMMTTLAEQGATNAVNPTLAGMQQEILAEVPQSAVSNSVMQPQDFIGSHLTGNVDNQALMNNYSGFTDGFADPMQAYPDFNNPVSSSAEELAMADGGYGGSIFDGFGDTLGKVNDFTGMEAKDWTKMGITQGANLLQTDPQKPIQSAPMGQGISRPQVDLSQSSGSLLSSNPMTSGAGGQQLTAEQIKLLQQKGLI